MIQAPISQKRFVYALSVVSIIGFIGIFSHTIIGKDITSYVEAAWLFVLAVGFLFEIDYSSLRYIGESGLTREVFAHLSTLVLALFAVAAGIFSLPMIRFENPGFIAVKGILALIAILVIIIQTWIIKED